MILKTDKKILDACCGSKMFWFNKQNLNTLFCDNRTLNTTLSDGRSLIITPDILMDFTRMPFESNHFKLVVFDPPHLINAGKNSWLVKKYGKLENNWKETILNGFNECWRVLDINGVLIFKWSETQILTKEILDILPISPLFGHKSGRLNKTHWMCFMKD